MTNDQIALASDSADQLGQALGASLATRRSRREFRGGSRIGLAEIGCLLWAGQGMRHDSSRTAPSAGAIYPLNLHVVVSEVDWAKPGCYSYDPEFHALDLHQSGDLIPAVVAATIDPSEWITDASCSIVVSVDFDALDNRFGSQPPAGERSRRYGYIEVGAAAQNMLLAACALDRWSVIVGGFDDDSVRSTLCLRDGLLPATLLPV